MIRKTSIATWALVLTFGGVGVSRGEAPRPSKEVPAVERLSGNYTYVGNRETDERTIDAQIEGAVDDMGGFIRKKARKKLEQVNSIPLRVRIHATEPSITVALDDFEVVAPTDGSKVAIKTPAGEAAQAFFHVGSASLVQEIEQPRATRTNTFHFRGDKLVMAVKETSSRLNAPVTYELVYAPTR